jgi:hypothetical protein
VTKFAKVLAGVCVLLLNLFFVYFSMARGLQRGLDWQRLYCVACVIQLTVEVLFYETTECAIVNFFIPDLARSEVQGVTYAIHQAIQSMCLSVSEVNLPLLDAPRYLFLSTRLAESFPDLVESVIVRSYHSYSPGELSRKWKISHASANSVSIGNGEVRIGSRVRRVTFTGLLVACFQYLGSASISVQRFFIHALQPVIMAGVAAVIAAISHDPLYLLLFTPVLGYAVYLLWEHFLSDNEEDGARMEAIVPLPESHPLPKASQPSSPSPSSHPKILQNVSAQSPNDQSKTAPSSAPPLWISDESDENEFDARELFGGSDSEGSPLSDDIENSNSIRSSDSDANPSDGFYSQGAGSTSSDEVLMDLGPFDADSPSAEEDELKIYFAATDSP